MAVFISGGHGQIGSWSAYYLAKEVELGFTEEMAIKEAKRCLRCDLELKEEVETS